MVRSLLHQFSLSIFDRTNWNISKFWKKPSIQIAGSKNIQHYTFTSVCFLNKHYILCLAIQNRSIKFRRVGKECRFLMWKCSLRTLGFWKEISVLLKWQSQSVLHFAYIEQLGRTVYNTELHIIAQYYTMFYLLSHNLIIANIINWWGCSIWSLLVNHSRQVGLQCLIFRFSLLPLDFILVSCRLSPKFLLGKVQK